MVTIDNATRSKNGSLDVNPMKDRVPGMHGKLKIIIRVGVSEMGSQECLFGDMREWSAMHRKVRRSSAVPDEQIRHAALSTAEAQISGT